MDFGALDGTGSRGHSGLLNMTQSVRPVAPPPNLDDTTRQQGRELETAASRGGLVDIRPDWASFARQQNSAATSERRDADWGVAISEHTGGVYQMASERPRDALAARAGRFVDCVDIDLAAEPQGSIWIDLK